MLIAYNVNIPEPDAAVAKMIGTLVRGSGRIVARHQGQRLRVPGMLDSVQGMGVPVDELGISQVSMNLLDVERCPLHLAFKTCESLAEDHDTALCGSEIVGLVPLQAMLEAGRYFSPDATSDNALVSAAVDGLGLNRHHHFDPGQHIIEWALEQEGNV